MGQVRKEQVFFLVTFVIVAYLAYSRVSDPYTAMRPSSGRKAEAADDAGTRVEGPRGELVTDDWLARARAFDEPKEWVPLPPVDLPLPPQRDPARVRFAVEPAVDLVRRGRYRADQQVRPHTFEDAAFTASLTSEDAAADLGDDSTETDDAGAFGGDSEFRRRYDWIELRGTSKPRYGFLIDDDKYTLPERVEDPIVFQEVNPETGKPGLKLELPRDRLKEDGVHLADSDENRVELLLRRTPREDRNSATTPRVLDDIESALGIPAADQYAQRRAAEEIEHCLSLDPKSLRGYEMLADVQADLLDFEQERAALERAVAEGLAGPGLVRREARWFERYGAKEHALALLERGALDFPADVDLGVAYGRALLDSGRTADALAQLERVEQATREPAAKRRAGRALVEALLGLDRLAEAEREASQLVAGDSRDPRAQRLLAAAQFAQGDAGAALESIQRALQWEADDEAFRAEATLALAAVSIVLGRFEEARSLLMEVPRRDPLRAAEAERSLVDLYEETGNDELALAAAHRALELEPEDAFAHYQLGRQLRRADDTSAARDSLREALGRGAVFPDLFAELGFTSLQSGDTESATRYFEESLAREPRDEVRILLARTHMVRGDLLLARRALDQASTSSAQLLALAWCDYRQGDSAQAQQIFQGVLNELQNAPEEDLEYARTSLAAILDVESKQRWIDPIRWRGIGNGWQLDSRFGVEEHTVPGRLSFSGAQRVGAGLDDWTMLHRGVESTTLHEFEVVLEVGPSQQGRAGMGLVKLGSGLGREPKPREALMLAVEGGSLYQQRRQNLDDPEAEWRKIADVPSGQPLRLTLRRTAPGEADFDLLLDGVRIGDPVRMDRWRGRQRQELLAVFFVAADSGKRVDAALTYAHLVKFLSEP